MRVAALLFFVGVALAAPPKVDKYIEQRIMGGSVTSIDEYPHAVALLRSTTGGVHQHGCGGTILNIRSVLSACHCFDRIRLEHQWRSRVGSTTANSGGVVFLTQTIIRHPNYDPETLDNDFVILRLFGTISYSVSIQPVSIAGPNYNLADDEVVWAIGWGLHGRIIARPSEMLRHVQIWTVNQKICRERYATDDQMITDNMLCAGWLDVGRRDKCQGDSGGPLYHNNVQVGVISWGNDCGSRFFPGVSARVSRAVQWISNNA